MLFLILQSCLQTQTAESSYFKHNSVEISLQSCSHIVFACFSLAFRFLSHTSTVKPVPQSLSLLPVRKDPPQSSCSDFNHSTLCLGTGISVDPSEIKQRCVIAFLLSLYKKYVASLLVPLRAELGCRLNGSYLQPYRTPQEPVLKVDVGIYFYHMSPSLLEFTLAYLP